MDEVKWGFLRETTEAAKAAGLDKDTGLHRTGLDEYLRVVFLQIDDWVHDKAIGYVEGVFCRKRPDYRSEKLKMIVEFDGLQHYTSPAHILRDAENTKFYEKLGYKVIRIPYFIQLTNSVVEQLFGVKVEEELFREGIPSLGVKSNNTPAFLCHRGIQRMAREYQKFPEQYKTNIEFLQTYEDQYLVDCEALEQEVQRIKEMT